MSTSAAATADSDQDEPAFVSRNPLDYVPGVLLLVAVGLLGKYAQVWWNALAKREHWTVPDIEYVLWAIVIGLVIANTVGVHRIFRPGLQTYEFVLDSRTRTEPALVDHGFSILRQSQNFGILLRGAF